jgi:hypothetical protein
MFDLVFVTAAFAVGTWLGTWMGVLIFFLGGAAIVRYRWNK